MHNGSIRAWLIAIWPFPIGAPSVILDLFGSEILPFAGPGDPFSTHMPDFVQVTLSAAEKAPETTFVLAVAYFYFRGSFDYEIASRYSWCTQNLSKIGRSVTKLLRFLIVFNMPPSAILISPKVDVDNFETSDNFLPNTTFDANISIRGGVCPGNEFKMLATSSLFLVPVAVLISIARLREPTMHLRRITWISQNTDIHGKVIAI